MKPNYLQVTGDNNYHYSVTTRINNEDGHNQLSTGLGGCVNIKHDINSRYLNRDRYSANYYQENKHRLRTAYLKYISSTID